MPELDLDNIEDLTDEEIAAAVRENNSKPSALRKNLERAHQERDEALAQVKASNDLARENAMLRAGIDMDDPKVAYFVKGYEGELTVDAVREAAVTAGYLDAKVTDPNLSEAQRAALVSVGAETLGTPETATQEAIAAINAAQSPEDVLAAYAKAGGRVKNPLDE